MISTVNLKIHIFKRTPIKYYDLIFCEFTHNAIIVNIELDVAQSYNANNRNGKNVTSIFTISIFMLVR